MRFYYAVVMHVSIREKNDRKRKKRLRACVADSSCGCLDDCVVDSHKTQVLIIKVQTKNKIYVDYNSIVTGRRALFRAVLYIH